MPDRCLCDACSKNPSSLEPWTQDGYCAFCSTTCFPVRHIGGREVRTALAPATRAGLHAAARVARHLPHDPTAATDAARGEAARAFVEIASPFVERGGKALIDVVRKRIRGTGAR
jgi:hypothetical protein